MVQVWVSCWPRWVPEPPCNLGSEREHLFAGAIFFFFFFFFSAAEQFVQARALEKGSGVALPGAEVSPHPPTYLTPGPALSYLSASAQGGHGHRPFGAPPVILLAVVPPPISNPISAPRPSTLPIHLSNVELDICVSLNIL